jgi:hypothetical protein
MATQYLDYNWTAYWAAADVWFKNEYEITERGHKMRSFQYKEHISNYFVKLRDLHRRVEWTAQIFSDQISTQMHSDIVDMMSTIGQIHIQVKEILQVLKMGGKCIGKKKRNDAKENSSSNKSYNHKWLKNKFKENKVTNDKKENNDINNDNNRIQLEDQKK